jgi:hypothetical protein
MIIILLYFILIQHLKQTGGVNMYKSIHDINFKIDKNKGPIEDNTVQDTYFSAKDGNDAKIALCFNLASLMFARRNYKYNQSQPTAENGFYMINTNDEILFECGKNGVTNDVKGLFEDFCKKNKPLKCLIFLEANENYYYYHWYKSYLSDISNIMMLYYCLVNKYKFNDSFSCGSLQYCYHIKNNNKLCRYYYCVDENNTTGYFTYSIYTQTLINSFYSDMVELEKNIKGKDYLKYTIIWSQLEDINNNTIIPIKRLHSSVIDIKYNFNKSHFENLQYIGKKLFDEYLKSGKTKTTINKTYYPIFSDNLKYILGLQYDINNDEMELLDFNSVQKLKKKKNYNFDNNNILDLYYSLTCKFKDFKKINKYNRTVCHPDSVCALYNN